MVIDPIVIGVGVKKRVGKDTVANRLVDHHSFRRLSFADPLKEAAKIIFHFTDEQLYGSLKEVIDNRWGKSPREILQLMGSDALRDVIDTDIWIKSLKIKIENLTKQFPSQQLRIVIPDVRYPNEAAAIQSLPNGYLWKIERSIPIDVFSLHSSEISLDSFTGWNTVLTNNESMSDLYQKVDQQFYRILNQESDNYVYNRRKAEST
jgi:hypothetical protein